MWYSLVTGAALKGTAVLMAAGMAALVLRRRSAAARHVVWTAAFAGLLALPLLSLTLPAVSMPLPIPGLIFRTGALAAVVPTGGETGSVRPAAREFQATRWHPDGRQAVLLLWAAGAAAAFLPMLLGWMAMARARRRARPLHAPGFEELQTALGIRHRVELLEAGLGSMPMTFGLFRPAVFLPADAAQWTEERRAMVLAHELAHVRRGDLASQVMARVTVSLYWWNPLVWMAWRAFLNERERAADDLVLSAGAAAADYAGHLLEIARDMRISPAMGWAALAMARRSQLEGRLLAILDSSANRGAPGRAVRWAACLATIALLAPFAALRAQDGAQTLPADVDATIRAAAAQQNHAILDGAAKAAESLRQYDVAQKLLESSLAIRAQASGEQSADYGLGLIKLGDLERSRSNFPEAEAFYLKALAVLGNRPEAAPALLALATGAMHNKDLGLAADYLERAHLADPRHAGQSLTWLAIVRERQENLPETDSLFRQAMALEDPHSPEAATTMELYGFFLDRHGRGEEAATIRHNATAIRQEQGTRGLTIRKRAGAAAYRVGNGVTPPSVLFKVEPTYTEEARLAKYQGTVVVSTEIGEDGTPQSMQVVRGLGLGLDEQAIKAISQWKFKPGSKDGQPVPVTATIEVNFRLL